MYTSSSSHTNYIHQTTYCVPHSSASLVKFNVVLKSDLFPVIISDDARNNDVIQCLKSQINTARRILGRSSFEQYDYYKLKNPVPTPHRNSNAVTIIQTCLDRNSWETVSAHDGVDALAQTLSNTHIYLMIQPKGELLAYILIVD